MVEAANIDQPTETWASRAEPIGQLSGSDRAAARTRARPELPELSATQAGNTRITNANLIRFNSCCDDDGAPPSSRYRVVLKSDF